VSRDVALLVRAFIVYVRPLVEYNLVTVSGLPRMYVISNKLNKSKKDIQNDCHILVMWTVWATTDFLRCYFMVTHMDISWEEDQKEMSRQYSRGLWALENLKYVNTLSISFQVGPDRMEKHCSQFGLPECKDNVIVVRVISQVREYRVSVTPPRATSIFRNVFAIHICSTNKPKFT